MIDKTTPTTASDSILTGSSTVQLVNPPSIDNRDPVGDLNNSTRVHQQQVIPGGIKQRNLTIQLLNDPDPTFTGNTEPFWFIFGGVPSNGTNTVNWTTFSNTPKTELFAVTQMSFYFSQIPYPDYQTFKAQGEQWPGEVFNMRDIICSFWQDEGLSDGYNVISRQSLYNFSNVTVYVMATMRQRVLANTSSLTSN